MTTAIIPFALASIVRSNENKPALSSLARLAMLEKASGGRLGVYAVNTDNEMQIVYRADERFSMCSTFKVILAGAVLNQSTQTHGLLQQRIYYEKSDLVAYSPISGKHVRDGITICFCFTPALYSLCCFRKQGFKINRVLKSFYPRQAGIQCHFATFTLFRRHFPPPLVPLRRRPYARPVCAA